jgi:hypothetical protein
MKNVNAFLKIASEHWLDIGKYDQQIPYISNKPLPHYRGMIFKPHWLDLLMFSKFMLGFSWVFSSCYYFCFAIWNNDKSYLLFVMCLSKVLIQLDTSYGRAYLWLNQLILPGPLSNISEITKLQGRIKKRICGLWKLASVLVQYPLCIQSYYHPWSNRVKSYPAILVIIVIWAQIFTTFTKATTSASAKICGSSRNAWRHRCLKWRRYN